jgi:DNA repair exonuclease SbcCD ATPase subunit
MRVETILLTNVGVHDSRTLLLPETGAVVVTGPNGSGKSSFVEGVALGLWGESLRGEALWREGVQGEVEVALTVGSTALRVKRKRTKAGAKSLSFSVDGADPVKYETPSKAQEALEAIVGTFDSWRRTSVLSSSDSAHFSLATDGERKRLLERLLGFDKLDDAADAARADLRKLEQRLSIAEVDTRNVESHHWAATSKLRQATDALAALGEVTVAPSDTESRLATLRKKLALADEEMRDANAELATCRDALATTKAEADAAVRRARLAANSDCPTCEQPIPATLKQRLLLEEAAAKEAVQRAAANLTQRQSALVETLRELEAEVQTIRADGVKLKVQKENAEKYATLATTLEGQVESAKTDLAAVAVKVEETKARYTALSAEVAVQKSVTEVFGLKGVRAHLLDKALRQVERVANRNLVTLSNGMKVKLSSTTEKKTGGTSDAISLRVSVRGADFRPYAGLSGGERRRVDVALLLALADVSGAAAGKLNSTLWMDEVFDALDGDGATAVGSLVERLGSSRTVVVITHSDNLVRSIRAAARLSL